MHPTRRVVNARHKSFALEDTGKVCALSKESPVTMKQIAFSVFFSLVHLVTSDRVFLAEERLLRNKGGKSK